MNLQQQSLHTCVTPFSISTMDSLYKRKPRFQRQKSANKCQCNSISKNKSSSQSFSLQRFYIKKSLIKCQTPQKSQMNLQSPQINKNMVFDRIKHNKLQLDSTRIQNKNDSQILQSSQINKFSQKINLSQTYLMDNNFSIQSQFQIQNLMKKAIFYKQKYQKYQKMVKQLRNEKKKYQSQSSILVQQNQIFRSEIHKLKVIINNYLSQDIQPNNSSRKSKNYNLTKLKQQYHNFRQQEQSSKKSIQVRYIQLIQKNQQFKKQNQKLKQDLVQHNELYNIKLKLMQQKQIFLQKTLSFTKNALNQLQKDYQTQQNQIIQSKKLKDIINNKTIQIQSLKNKYNNIVKMLNGQKKRKENTKIINDQYKIIPIELKSRHSLQIKNSIYNHKQNDQLQNTLTRNKTAKQDQSASNLIKTKIIKPNYISKQNYQISSIKKIIKNKNSIFLEQIFQKPQNTMSFNQQIASKIQLKSSSSELTLLSSNSLELSPEK